MGEQVWDALEEGMEKYHGVLEERRRIAEEAEGLKRQNAELRVSKRNKQGQHTNAMG